MGFTLEDAEAAHRASPRTFGLPRLAERTSLRVGQLVKLIFVDDAPPEGGFQAERMWVQIVAVERGGYRGRLDNVPRQIRLSPGDEVDFEPRHVSSVYVDAHEELRIDPASWAIASRRVLDDGRWPAIVYRAAPLAEHDSGFRVLAGDEDERTMRDAHAFRPVLLHTLAATNACFDWILGEPARVTWRWDEAACEHVRAPFKTVRRLSKQLVAHAFRHRVAPAPAAFRKGMIALVDDRVLGGLAPLYVYREKTDRANDSGFRVFANGDYEEFERAGSASTFVPIMRLLRAHPRLDVIFGTTATEGDWEWEPARGRYVRARE